MPKAKPSVMVELWSINKWLRWTGVRLAIQVDIEHPRGSLAWEPTKLGLVWWGWKDLFPSPQVTVGNFVPCDPTMGTLVEDALDPLPERPHGRGHCGHAPKCINSDEHRDERDPLGCCNCGTRKAEQAPPLEDERVCADCQKPLAVGESHVRDFNFPSMRCITIRPPPTDAELERFAVQRPGDENLAALQAALPPVDAQAESRLERLLVEKRKHFPGDANKVRLQARDAGQHGPAAHPSLKPASDNCQHPIKGEFGTWCKGCTACGTSSDDTDSW